MVLLNTFEICCAFLYLDKQPLTKEGIKYNAKAHFFPHGYRERT